MSLSCKPVAGHTYQVTYECRDSSDGGITDDGEFTGLYLGATDDGRRTFEPADGGHVILLSPDQITELY